MSSVFVACSFHHTSRSSCSETVDELEKSKRWILDHVSFPALTCKNAVGLSRQVNLILLCDAQHHGFGPPVVLGGQQPAQGLWENPAESKERKDKGVEKANQSNTEYVVEAKRRIRQTGEEENNGRIRLLFLKEECAQYCVVLCVLYKPLPGSVQDPPPPRCGFPKRVGLTRRRAASERRG